MTPDTAAKASPFRGFGGPDVPLAAPAANASRFGGIAEVRRELALRERVYPKRIGAGMMTRGTAERQTLHLRAVLETLLSLQK